jgi:hypothetical protein
VGILTRIRSRNLPFMTGTKHNDSWPTAFLLRRWNVKYDCPYFKCLDD